MKLYRVAIRSASNVFYHHHQLDRSIFVRNFSTNLNSVGHDENKNANLSESADDFSSRIFGNFSDDSSNTLFRRFDNLKKAQYGSGQLGYDDPFSTLTDGMEWKLKEAAKYFELNPNEVMQEDYTYRTDMNFKSGMTYTPEDLDLRKPGVWKPSKRGEFQVTTEEVLKRADFRNVRFLANFLTDAGILNKRSKTGISAKAQRKVAREIKTARAFGLLPFTTMGTKQFAFGITMEDRDEDFQSDGYRNRVDEDVQDPISQTV